MQAVEIHGLVVLEGTDLVSSVLIGSGDEAFGSSVREGLFGNACFSGITSDIVRGPNVPFG
jgi:hypothetical protein